MAVFSTFLFLPWPKGPQFSNSILSISGEPSILALLSLLLERSFSLCETINHTHLQLQCVGGGLVLGESV